MKIKLKKLKSKIKHFETNDQIEQNYKKEINQKKKKEKEKPQQKYQS